MDGRLLILSVALASGGCASRQPPAPTDQGAAAAVELIVVNRTSRTVTAFAEWRSGARIRLGEVGSRTTISFTTPYRDSEVWLLLDVVSSTPPVGTTSDPRVFSGGSRSGRGGGDRSRGSFVTIYPGDRYEWEIRTLVPAVDMYFRRLTPG